MVLAVGGLAWAGQPSKRPSDAVRGEELYRRHCIQCHGEMNLGDGPATLRLVNPVPDLQGAVKSDDATLNIVLRGRETMPGYENSFDKFDARRVTRYMANLGNAQPDNSRIDDRVEDDAPADDAPADDIHADEDAAPAR
jgi:mono/diheme cytochrome c family protein